MPSLVQQSTTQLALKFLLVLSSDHISPATGLSPTVTIRKEGGAFGSPAGTVTEIANGWYQVAANATDSNTLGDVLLHATGTGADPTDVVAATVVAFNPQNANLGLSNVVANVTQWNGAAVASAAAGIPKVDIDTIRTNPVVNAGTVTLPTNATVASTTNITAGTVTTVSGNVNGSVGSVTGAVASVIAPVTVGTNNDKTGYALTSGERTSIADAMLDRDMAVGTDSGSPTVRTVRQALRFLRNKWSISGSTLTVTKEDDTTASWTSSLTTTPGADPITGFDPAG